MLHSWCTHHRNVEEAVKRSLDNFGTDYLDLCAGRFLPSLKIKEQD